MNKIKWVNISISALTAISAVGTTLSYKSSPASNGSAKDLSADLNNSFSNDVKIMKAIQDMIQKTDFTQFPQFAETENCKGNDGGGDGGSDGGDGNDGGGRS